MERTSSGQARFSFARNSDASDRASGGLASVVLQCPDHVGLLEDGVDFCIKASHDFLRCQRVPPA